MPFTLDATRVALLFYFELHLCLEEHAIGIVLISKLSHGLGARLLSSTLLCEPDSIVSLSIINNDRQRRRRSLSVDH